MRTSVISALLPALLWGAAAPAQTDINFSYDETGGPYKCFGYNKKETYDVAIKIDNPAFTGAKIKGLYTYFPVEQKYFSEGSGFVTTELKVENKANVANLATAAGEFRDDILYVTFPEPVTIPEGGVYVGYTFKVDEVEGQSGTPIVVVNNDNPNGLWVHASRSQLKWTNLVMNFEGGVNSAMVVQLEGDFTPEGAAVRLPELTYVEAGKEGSVRATVTNAGSSAITQVDYSYIVNGQPGQGTIELPTPIEAKFGAVAQVEFPLPAYEEAGTYDISLTINKVNGVQNTNGGATAAGKLAVVPFIPVCRPLVEEYTGLWCQYCPRGYVALEQLSRDYGDLFVALAFHNDDAMAITSSYPAPFDGSAFPMAVINREQLMDPELLPQTWPAYTEGIAPASVDVALSWADEQKSVLRATASVDFVLNLDNTDYRLSYALLEDGMSNPNWAQSNAFAGDTSKSGDLWDLFTKAGRAVFGLEFNDVVVSYNDYYGVAGSLPSSVRMGQTYTHTYDFDLSTVVNYTGAEMIQDVNKLRAVAILIDARTGKPVNCNYSTYVDGTGVEALPADTTVLSTEWYDLTGRRVTPDALAAPAAPSLLLRVDRLSDGTLRTTKHLR